MQGQMSIFDFLHEPQPGDWLDDGDWTLGDPIGFDELQPGMLVWHNKSTESMEWWKCEKVDHAYRDSHGDVTRWIMNVGKGGPEYHSRLYYACYKEPPMHGEVWYRKVI